MIYLRLLLLGLLLSLPFTLSAKSKARPNVLFLAVDDMNDWIGSHEKSVRAITPNLDKLAASGVNFTNAHTAGVFCAPSRAAIFSGQFASTTGCYQSANYFTNRPEIESLQTSFSKAGYTTLGTGKLYHHPVGAIDPRGWTEFFLRTKEQRENGWAMESWGPDTPFPAEFPASVYNKGTEITGGMFLEWGAVPDEREEEMADTMRVNWTVEQLKKKPDKPFFLACGIYAPHYPNYCPQKYFDLYDRDEISLPPLNADDLADLPPKIQKMKAARSRILQRLQDLDAYKDAVHGYLACVSYADAMMGRILDALAESPHADNTIVVLWSDHGYHLGEKGDWGKHTLWERSSSVPFIWAGPGIAKDVKTDLTASLIDMYPTFVELCGLPSPHQKLEGQSLAKTLKNPGEAEDRSVFLPHMHPGEYAVINRDWRYIRYGEDGEELYNLQEDPHEWTNLASAPEHAARMAAMRKVAPAEFAEPEAKFNSRRDLVIDGESYRWEKGKGNYTPPPKHLPYNPPLKAAGKKAKTKTTVSATRGSPEKPNIVVILTDDQGYADISFNPNHPKEVSTPHMDALAKEGVFFTNGYTSGSVCSPTRAGLMLGEYQQRVGVYTAGDGGRGFDPEFPIFPSFFPKEYKKSAIGKWHLGLDEDYPELKWHAMNRGFTECYKFMGRGGHDYFSLKGAKGDGYEPIYQNKTRLKEDDYEGYLTTRLTEEAVDFIDREKDNPFFLYLAYNAVHSPSQAPQDDIDRYKKQYPGITEQRAILMAMLEHLDKGVGAVVQ
ncbi:MAG: sulfatase-like hydrolase/transferase, partial [Verrucomicrobiota bacterium]